MVFACCYLNYKSLQIITNHYNTLQVITIPKTKYRSVQTNTNNYKFIRWEIAKHMQVIVNVQTLVFQVIKQLRKHMRHASPHVHLDTNAAHFCVHYARTYIQVSLSHGNSIFSCVVSVCRFSSLSLLFTIVNTEFHTQLLTEPN